MYSYVAADHDWWLAYDADPEPGRYEMDSDLRVTGPWHRWTTYPSRPWEHLTLLCGILKHDLADLYWEHDPEEWSDIYRSKVVPLRDVPDRVQKRLRS